MDLIYMCERAYPGPKDIKVVLVTQHLGVALERARRLQEGLPRDALGSVWVTAWADGDHAFVYVNLETGQLFDYDREGKPYDVQLEAFPRVTTTTAAPMPEVWVEEEEMT